MLVDGQTKPNVIARETVKLLAQQPAPAGLIGLSDTDMVLAAARIAAVHSHVFITSGATSPKLPHEVPRYLFLACFGDNVQAAAGAEFAVKTLKARTAIVLYKESSTYAKLLHGYFETRFKELGGKVLIVRGYTAATVKAKVQGLPKADLVYLAAQPDDVAAAVPALRGAGIAAPILGGDGLDIGAAWQQVARADHVYFTTHAYLGADNPDPRVKAFRAAFAKAYPDKQPDAFSALGYDTARLLAGGDQIGRRHRARGGAQGARRHARFCRRDRHHRLSRRQPHPGQIGHRHVGHGRPAGLRDHAAAGENPAAIMAPSSR